MQIRSLFSLTKYSLLASLRNPETLIFGFIFPFVFIIVFGLLGQGDASFDIGVKSTTDKDNPIYKALDDIEAFNLITDKTDDENSKELLKGSIPAVIEVVPEKVQTPAGEITKYKVNLTTTSAEPQNGQTILSIVKNITDSINNPPDPNKFNFVDFTTDNVEGRKYERIDFILPGQLGFAALSTGIFGIAYTFIVFKQTLVIKRLFATPVKKSSIILSQVLSRLVIAALQAAVIVIVGHFLFNFTLANGVATVLNMLIVVSIGLIVFFGFGLLISSISRDENAVPAIANLFTLPQFLLSGTFFPISAFPEFLQPIAKLLPLTFMNDALRKISFEGVGLEGVLPEIAALIIWAVIVYALVVRVFKWE